MFCVLDNSHEPRRRIDDTPFIKGVSFWRGAIITQEMPSPLEFLLKTYMPSSPNQSPHIPAFFDCNPPLFEMT